MDVSRVGRRAQKSAWRLVVSVSHQAAHQAHVARTQWLICTGGGYPSPIDGGFIGWLPAAIWWRVAGRQSESPEDPGRIDKQSVSDSPA